MMRNEGGRAWDGKINDDGKTKEENSNFHISSVSSRERVRVAKKFLTMKFAGSDEKGSALLCEKRISKFHCEPLRLMPKKKILCCCFTLPWRRENLRNPPLLRLDSHLHKVNYILMFSTHSLEREIIWWASASQFSVLTENRFSLFSSFFWTLPVIYFHFSVELSPLLLCCACEVRKNPSVGCCGKWVIFSNLSAIDFLSPSRTLLSAHSGRRLESLPTRRRFS